MFSVLVLALKNLGEVTFACLLSYSCAVFCRETLFFVKAHNKCTYSLPTKTFVSFLINNKTVQNAGAFLYLFQ